MLLRHIIKRDCHKLIISGIKMSRFKAFAIHFGISLIIFSVLLYFILVQWYPEPLFSNDGGWTVIRIIAGVDLVLGPLLTLIVYKAGKPGLKFDLSMIALFQTLALTWGVWTTYNERPAAIIYSVDFFTPVPAYQLKEQGIDANELKKYGNEWPILIYSDIPKDKEQEAFITAYKTGKAVYLLKEYYKKFSPEIIDELKNDSMNLEKYVKDKPKLQKLYQHALLSHSDLNNFSYLALHSRDRWVTAIFDLDTFRIVDTIDIEPSAYTSAKKIKIKRKETKKE